MKIGDAIARLKDDLGAPAADPDYEGLCAGRPDAELTGAAACSAPSLEVLTRAAAGGANLILADGHPFYAYDPLRNGLPPPTGAVEASPPVLAKRKLIEAHGLTIFRLRSAWTAARPAAAPRALATTLGLGASLAEQDFVTCAQGRQLAGELVADIRRRTRLDGLRLIGDGRTPISRIAVSNGLVTPKKLGRMLAGPAVDAVVCGEVVEWEAGPYMQDVIASGRRAVMILTGFAASQEPVAAEIARWARGVLPAIPIFSLRSADPVWTPKGRAG